MTISSGTKLGSFEIVSRIGAGGMGEVWRAKDAKIARRERSIIRTSSRTPWKEIIPSDIAGSLGHTYICMNPDGDAYAYSIERMMTDLFIVEGLR
jgi:serine/threonine protein kinase